MTVGHDETTLYDLAPVPARGAPTEPPHDLAAEETVIGSILKSGKAIAAVYARLKPEHFYSLRFRTIYQAMTDLFEQGVAIDLSTLMAHLEAQDLAARVGGILGLSEIEIGVPSAFHIEHYADQVLHYATRRSLLAAAAEIAETVYRTGNQPLTPDGTAALVRDAQARLVQAAGNVYESRILLPHQWVNRYYEYVSEVGGESGTLGASTGWITFDRLWLGLQPGLNFIGGRPGFGKSELLWNMAVNVGLGRRAPNTKCNAPTGWSLFFSIEMSDIELAERATAGESGVAKEKLIYGRFNPTDAEHINATLELLLESRIALVVEAGLTSQDVRAYALQHEAKTGPIEAIFVDYVQLLADKSGEKGNRNYDLGLAAANLKALSKELDCTVIAACQLGRGVDARPDKRPILADLRDSGELEQHCNIATMIYRGDLYGDAGWEPGVSEVINRKHRRWGQLRNQTAKMVYARDGYRDYQAAY